jgi:thiamine transport system substrate-binding protein
VFRRNVLTSALALVALLLAAAGCGGGGGGGSRSHTLVVATHDSWAMSKSVMAEFTRETGIKVKIQPQGDAGELTNKLVLTKDNPVADGVYGIDNTFGPRAVSNHVLAPYAAHLPAGADRFRLPGDPMKDLTPVDYSDVCVNVDDSWFASHHLAPPRTLDDLTKPAYKNLFVTPGATTSSPGLAFLYATIAAHGGAQSDVWKDYWRKLMANGTKITSGWSDAYEVDFTAGGGKGDRPIVTSYSSSPPFTIPKGASKPTTSALLDTCFRQVEYAGVLEGSNNPAGMRKFIDFMLRRQFQAALPDNMYVYPVNGDVPLPRDWARWATPAKKPWFVDPATMASKMNTLLGDWRDVTSR